MITRSNARRLFLCFTLQLVANSCHAGYQSHGHTEVAPTQTTLRVLAYNIRHGLGMDDSLDLARSAAVIRSLHPDLVALQEVDSATERTLYIDQASELGKLTNMRSVFGEFMGYRGGKYGMALLSRYPIRRVQNHRLPGTTEPRSALTILVRHAPTETELLFVGIHLYRTADERLAQARTLVDVLSGATVPIILAGDFNSTPGSEVMNLLQQHWYIPDKGEERLTFPSDDPQREIDFIIFRPRAAFEIVESRVIDEPLASDHRPVLLTLKLTPTDKPSMR